VWRSRPSTYDVRKLFLNCENSKSVSVGWHRNERQVFRLSELDSQTLAEIQEVEGHCWGHFQVAFLPAGTRKTTAAPVLSQINPIHTFHPFFPAYWLLFRGEIVQSLPCTAAISDLLCVPIWVIIVPDSSTRPLWQILAETPSSEARKNVARNFR
jgi:hypothetical protein